MNERDKQFRVGMLVIGTLLISGILVLIFDGLPKFGTRPYILYLRFKEAPGVSDGTPIRKSGIRIGRVQSLKFAEDIPALRAAGETGVVATVEIESSRQVRHNEVPQIRQSLLGDAFVEFVLDRSQPDNAPLYSDGDTLAGIVQSNPLEFISKMEGDLALTMRSVANTSGEIGGLARRISDLLKNNDEQFVRIVAKTEMSIDGLQKTIAHVDQLVGDPEVQASIKAAARELPHAMAELRESVAHLKPS
ncbi:MAG: MCE family protein, partial [Planctomycetaceae bacterium]|nr:MCE family protein [Planctomycetaceae bacterium]